MNSSGIKRGLAATAVSALAIAGIPLLASSASAEAGETLTVVNVGPTLNGGTLGGQVQLKLSSTITQADIEAPASQLRVSNPNLNGPASNGNQAVAIVGTPTYIANGAPGDSNPTDGLAEAIVNVAVTTSDTGATATYAIYVDDDGAGTDAVPDVDAGEARVQVSQTTSGATATIAVDPASQSTSQGITSGAYTLTAKDAQGRTTQLQAGDTVAITSSNNAEVPPSDASGDATEFQNGTHTFTATPSAAPASLGTTTFTIDPNIAATPAAPNATATLTVTPAASITDANVDIVTAADSWNGFGNTPDSDGDNTLTLVRVDQGSVKIDVKGGLPNAGATVTLNLNGDPDGIPANMNSITFGGKTTTSLNVVLDASGNGSITITPDAGTIQDGETIAITGSFTENLVFDRAEATRVVSGQDLYFSALKATTTVTATVLDQFNNPITGGFVAAYRDAAQPNAETPPGQVKPVGADGTVSFDFTDTNAQVGDTDTVTFGWVPDQFTPPTAALQDTATIRYTATGQGADYNTTLDGVNTGTPTYKAADVTIIPLADGVADDDGVPPSNESAPISISGAEPNQAISLSVDNGARIVNTVTAPNPDTWASGVASVDAVTTAGGALTGYAIVGGKSGVTTLTIVSANRTETVQFTVAAQTDPTTARNVEVTGEDTVENGTTQVPFTVKVTDAHGNGVANIPASALNIQVTGPGQFQDSSGVTNANGELTVNVRADADAEGEIGITVTGLPAATNQFGAGANQATATSAANSAPGLEASDNQGSATTVIEAAPEPVNPEVTVTRKNKGKKDVITVKAIPAAAGASVVVKGGGQTKTGTLNENGKLVVTFKDKNGKKKTKYTITVGATDATTAKTVTKKFS